MFRRGDSRLPAILLGGVFVRREELLQSDLISEITLVGFAALIIVILLLILVGAST
jgi:hypothetical protein